MTHETIRIMTPTEQFFSGMRNRWVRFSRRFPRLVWHGDEVDVRITFKEAKLPPMPFGGEEHALTQAVKSLNSGALAAVERQLAEIGIGFDKGMGLEGRDWEWDWSLRGPVSVTFRGRARKAERRS